MKTKTEINFQYQVSWLMYPTATDATNHTKSFATRQGAIKFFNNLKVHREGVMLHKITTELLAEAGD